MSVVECAWIWIALPPQMFGCYNFFRGESTLETKCEIIWDQHAYSTCSGLKTLYVCTFYNPDEGDTISLENF